MIRILCTLIFTMGVFFAQGQSNLIPIIPRPAQSETRLGNFELGASTLIYAKGRDTGALAAARLFQKELLNSAGLYLKVNETGLNEPAGNAVIFETIQTELLGEEGYTLDINPTRILIQAGHPAGLFYGFQSLSQLIPASYIQDGLEFKNVHDANLHIRLQALFIKDVPAFAWRGMHLDVSRHFFGKEVVKSYLDYMSRLKMNRFHWHLTDSQGWRIEIKRYPLLTQVGAFRVERKGERFFEAGPRRPGEVLNYGGFYTQEDIREIVAYAAARHIVIVPEIDMPGHAMAALVAYPHLASVPQGIAMPSGRVNAYTNSFNPGNDSTYVFLENVLSEVIALFPSNYIHIGGDEVDRSIWKDNPDCLALIKKEKMKTLGELQSYFTRRIEKMISSRGRKMIGWDEILDGGLAPDAVVMSWRGFRGGIMAARARHEVVMAPSPYCYLDLYQGDPKLEPEAYSRNTLSTTYQFDPMPPNLSPADRKYILGGHGALWTETVADLPHLQHMLFPRLFALAECEWTPQNRKNYDDFKLRLNEQLERLSKKKISWAKSAWNVWLRPQKDTAAASVLLSCSNEQNQGQIRYTQDGTIPDGHALVYSKPFQVKGRQTIRAATFENQKMISEVNTEDFETSKTTSKQVSLKPGPSLRFAGYNSFSLCDGILGTANPFDGRWQGFAASQFNATIDLGRIEDIQKFGINFLEEKGLSIYLPLSLDVEVSDDGRNYIGFLHYDEKDLRSMLSGNKVKVYREFKPITLRYLRVTAQNRAPGPDDDGKTYLMLDEISAN